MHSLRTFFERNIKWVARLFCFGIFIASVVYAHDVHRIDPGETEEFPGSQHDPCATIVHDNTSSEAFFVPAKTNSEWQSFYDSVDNGDFSELSFTPCPIE